MEKQHPLPTLEELKDYYDRSYADGLYRDFTDAGEMKALTAAQRLKRIVRHCRAGKWLDVGCADGVFVEEARKSGVEVEGIEYSQVAVNQARKLGRDVYFATAETWIPPYRYDTVTAFDVLEHVPEPVQFLEALHRLVNRSGTLVLTVPDQGCLLRRIMGKRWYFYIPEEHLHYFNSTNLRRLLERTKFEVMRCVRTSKPLTLRYSLVQFREYNPLLFRMLNLGSKLVPRKLQNLSVPLYIGEMLVIARRRECGRQGGKRIAPI